MYFTAESHTWVICAYRESPYLEECIISLQKQTIDSNIIVSTSTPCPFISDIAKKYGLKLYINTDKQSIADDWNYGYQCAKTALVTIAHQDDIYEPEYLKNVIEAINREKHPLIAFTDYGELRGTDKVYDNTLLKVKKILLFPFRFKAMRHSRFIRRSSLSFGSGICCPSVTYVKYNLPEKVFERGYRSCVDWQAWEKISRLDGEFVYCHKPLMLHRIHKDSETTRIIADKQRTIENYKMFCCFWPKWFSKIIIRFYDKGEDSNNLENR